MTYGQAHEADPALAAASPIDVNPNRLVWVLTVHFAKPEKFAVGRCAPCPPTATDRSIRPAATIEVVDAAPGDVADSADMAAAAPAAKPTPEPALR